jgi:predicted transcriptional regulator
MTDSTSVIFRASPDVREMLRKIAAAWGCSVSAAIRRLIISEYARQEASNAQGTTGN